MKSTLLATAAGLALFALPLTAVAAPPDTGMVQANIGFGWDGNDDNVAGDPFDDPFTYGARTQWLFPLSKPIHIQGDLFIQQINDVLEGSFWPETDSTLIGGTVHLIHPMDDSRLGIAGSIYNVDVLGPAFSSGVKGVDYALVALEDQFFTSEWTLLLQGGWFGDMNGCDGLPGCVHDGFFLRGNATYFISKNTDINFDAALFFADDEFRGDVNGGTVRLEGEHKFDNSSFSAFIGIAYEHEEVQYVSEQDQEVVTIDIGLRAYIDQMSLFDFSQDGPSLNTPTFHHALASEGTLQLLAGP